MSGQGGHGAAWPPFTDRDEAGRLLADVLAGFAGRADVSVLGLPRGGVIVAAAVADRLGAALGVVVVRKIRSPGQAELAMGALALWGERVAVIRVEAVLDAVGVSREQFDREQEGELAAARARAADLGSAAPDVAGRTVIVVDDGLATGATMRAALQVVRDAGAAITVAAVPVGPPRELAGLRVVADEVVCVHAPTRFGSVATHYLDFGEVSDDAVRAELGRRR
jgi:putative phosphoribosyl transferase